MHLSYNMAITLLGIYYTENKIMHMQNHAAALSTRVKNWKETKGPSRGGCKKDNFKSPIHYDYVYKILEVVYKDSKVARGQGWWRGGNRV